MRAARRWSRSAATANGSTGPTRSIRPGTTSSTRTGAGREVMAEVGANGGLELDKDYWVSLPRRIPRPPDPARGRRLLDGFILLPVGLIIELGRLDTGMALAGVIASGLYHGINPGMGWPLAVSAGLMEEVRAPCSRRSGRCRSAIFSALLAGVLAIRAVARARRSGSVQIQIAAGLLVIGFGVFRLLSGAIRVCWPGSGRRSSAFGRSRSRSRTAPA